MSGSAASGLFGALQRALHTVLGLAQVRLELLGTELEQEKLRIFDALWRAALALLLLGLAAVGLLAFLILLLQEGYRVAAVGVLTVGLAATGGWLLHRARHVLQSPSGGPFALSLGELQRDRQGLVPPASTEGPTGAEAPGRASGAGRAAASGSPP